MAAHARAHSVSSSAAYASGWRACLDTAANADADAAAEAELTALARAEGPLRAVLAELCARFVACSGFERLGFASLADWAAERIGRSGRTVYDHARVGEALRRLPSLRAALRSGALGFAKVRLVARVATAESERRWIDFARAQSADALAREVRVIDSGALECDGLARDDRSARRLEYACSAEVAALWGAACAAAQQVAGRMLRTGERAELIAAEVASALPIDTELLPPAAPGASDRAPIAPCDSGGADAAHSGTSAPELPAPSSPTSLPLQSPWLAETSSGRGRGACDPEQASLRIVAGPTSRDSTRVETRADAIPPPPALDGLLEGVDRADAFELEQRLVEAFSFEQRWAALLGPLLAAGLGRGVHLAFGYRERETYQRERLGLDPSWCRALLRVENAAGLSPAVAEAWRAGELSFLQAAALVPLLHSELPEATVTAWIRRARDYSLRRLRDDVDAALALREVDFDRWRATGGLPESAHPCAAGSALAPPASPELEREIRAKHREVESEGFTAANAEALHARCSDRAGDPPAAPEGEREIGAKNRVRETCRVSMILETEAAQLFRAVHCSVRRRLERGSGRAVTPGEALGWISAHALSSWNAIGARTRREHRVFARDGWRCAAPGCTRMRGLHAHHVIFRARGGANDDENLVTLCAYHHLRGVHGGTLRISGSAPSALRFELGIRAGRPPLAVYGAGDRRLANGGQAEGADGVSWNCRAQRRKSAIGPSAATSRGFSR